MKRTHDSLRGFTLVEVVLALAILGAGVFGLIAAASRCLAVARSARDYEVARRTLDLGDLDHPLMAHLDPKNVEVGPTEYPDGFKYSREIEEVPDQDDLFIVHTMVRSSREKRKATLDVMQYYYTTNYPGFEMKRGPA
jgi:prepilin-type N-terminal cleavage/methylation domain-containing protein